ncbi:MAG TPA: hypothetical protein VF270_08465 [Ignavibacteriaceae bacterium]
MSKLRKNFSEKEWKKCCGSFCKDCDIANAYRDNYGKKEGEKKFNKDYKKQMK